jgi:hypothetical protein
MDGKQTTGRTLEMLDADSLPELGLCCRGASKRGWIVLAFSASWSEPAQACYERSIDHSQRKWDIAFFG